MRRSILPLYLLAFSVLWGSAAISRMAWGEELETIDGTRFTATLQSINSAGDLMGPGIEAGMKLDNLRTIVREVKSNPAKSRYVLETHGSGRLLANEVLLQNDKFTVSLAGGKEMVLPLEAARCLRLEPDLDFSSFNEALAKPSAAQDKIFVKVEKQIDAIAGLVLELTATELTFERDGTEHKLPRDRVHGIVLAQAGEPKLSSATVQLTNGSRLAARITGLQEGELQLELQGGAKAALPFNSVDRIDLRSSRMSYLSDLDPVTVTEAPILGADFPWRRDRSASGKPLTLGTREFSRGIGVHANSELEFEIPTGFTSFVVTVGIDAAGQARGDCEVEILGDDRSLWSQRVRGTEEAKLVQVDLKGARRLMLRVKGGEDYDFGDHVDWADARFLKEPSKK